MCARWGCRIIEGEMMEERLHVRGNAAVYGKCLKKEV